MLRKTLTLSCMAFLIVLFINGLYVLSSYGHENRYNRIGITKEETDEPLTLQEESSIQANMPVNVLVLGLDEDEVRTDVILLVNFNPENSRVNLLSIARDTRVYSKGKYTKINSLYASGREALLASKIKELTGLDTHYYVTMNFKGFRKIIDTLDGVMFYVPFNMNYDDPEQNLHIHLKKGMQLLNGKKAEQLVRYRKGNRLHEGYIDGDIGRIRMQQDFIKALVEQKLNLKYLTRADEIFEIISKYFRTNIDISDFVYYLPSIKNIKAEEIQSFTLPGESAMKGDTWYFIADLDKTRELIQSNFYE